MLNATLTVRAHQAASHQRQGWEEFTDAAIRALAEERENLVFILWGAYAQKKEHLSTETNTWYWHRHIRHPYRHITDFSEINISAEPMNI